MASTAYARIAKERQTEASRRVAKPVTCRKCGADCLRGEDHDKAALDATVDAESVDLLGEMLAHFEGLGTYDLRPALGKGYDAGATCLVHRSPWAVNANRDIHPIHVDHRCERAA